MKENKTDPICGMQGTIPKHGHYFCSEHCIKKYEKEHGILADKREDKEYCPSCKIQPGTPWYKEKLFIFAFLTIFLLLISFLFYKPLFEALWNYILLIWWAILLGLLIGAVLFLIMDVNRPQRGSLKVGVDTLERARGSISGSATPL